MIVTMEYTIKITPQVPVDLPGVLALVGERMPEESVVVEHADHVVVTLTTEVDC